MIEVVSGGLKNSKWCYGSRSSYKGVATHFSRVLNTQESRNSKKGFFGRLIKQFSCRKYRKQRGDVGILRATFEQRFEKFLFYFYFISFI